MTPALATHLAGGATTLARAWAIRRRDGVEMGFTDHDRPLFFAGIDFRPDAGFAARMLVSGSGLAVDNTEVLGALSHEAITAAEIEAGRWDGAEVRAWIVNWADPAQRHLRFRGHLGEIRRAEGAFHAELRGLTDALNRPQGRVFQRDCAAVLGDATCRFDPATPGFSATRALPAAGDGQHVTLPDLGDHADRWFEKGRVEVLTGSAAGLAGVVKDDRLLPDGSHALTLWEPIRAPLAAGDSLRLIAGCDRRAATCRLKFDNLVNFQGFPDIPGDGWIIAGPRAGRA